jgi:hypothetical protein
MLKAAARKGWDKEERTQVEIKQKVTLEVVQQVFLSVLVPCG